MKYNKKNILGISFMILAMFSLSINDITYKNKSNVVGRDIFFQNFRTLKLINNNTPFFYKKLSLFKK